MKMLLPLFLSLFLTLPAVASPSLEIKTQQGQLETKANRYYSYNFGSQWLHFSRCVDFTLRNTGSQPVQLRGVFIMGSSFWAQSNCPPWLAPGQVCLTRVEFRPWFEGSHHGRLRFAFIEDSIYVELFGWGVRN
ncbi:MAG: hypothetical protein OM95_02240 [Bdellovibrio sp. ArHS]|uniref:hypothetical protein n=1 Tax=Bdellovibrio sp. ArHS TaxID=1569284 RepID=UPI000583364D|nr:hypothetical protein [Bdellovibrio sp. ArHS]KHD89575.1 MAG: hypothetical protein OM95_02240 [Bdellovibrio sp. ArHS]